MIAARIADIKRFLSSKSLLKKLFFTIAILAAYRLLVLIPVPFVEINELMSRTLGASELGYFLMLLGGSLESFSIIAVGLAPYINASIIMQLLTAVVPQLEELTEQGEVGQQKIQQYTRLLTFPLALLQGIGMVFFINYLLGGQVISTDPVTVGLSALTLAFGSMIVLRLGELITERGIGNGISLLIFASIVAGITQQISVNFSSASDIFGMLIFMLVLLLGLILLSILILRSIKEIPIVYARQGTVRETAVMPIPLNPVGMIPIIFSIAFITAPFLLARLVQQFQPMNERLMPIATRIESNLNIYAQQPTLLTIVIFLLFIVAFTFFYALIVFSPERIADNIQKRGGFIPGIRPGRETAHHLGRIINHLCLRGGLGLGLIGIYSYILQYIPFIQDIVLALGSLPVVVTGSGVIIIVGVVYDILSKVRAELLMTRYDDSSEL